MYKLNKFGVKLRSQIPNECNTNTFTILQIQFYNFTITKYQYPFNLDNNITNPPGHSAL